jgi:cytochrome c biogenesis protein CcdA/thiol-disulfide isomerase/thioredoxin
MEVLLLFAFISGLVTIFAPCIWPLLPIILSASTSGGHRKPLGITLGIVLSFAVITLTISYIVKIIPFNPDVLRYFAVVIIGFLGLTLVIPALSQRLEAAVSRLSGKLGNVSNPQKTGFGSGFITGFALGIVWTPCAGPILATIATLAATQAVNLNVILVTIVYVIGVGIPLFIFATAGSALFTKSRLLSKYTGRIQQVFGVIMILTALSIATNYDKVLQTKLLDAFPSYSSFLTGIENNKAVKTQLDALKGSVNPNTTYQLEGSSQGQAPDFVGINKWLNLPAGEGSTDKSLSMKDLRGKVVLVDFWTYTCINCIRTLPYITKWYDTYKDKGFVVIGVHTPEFEFEKNTDNVSSAIKRYNIHYPVAQDNDYATWTAYNNQYWPAHYLIDAKGVIRDEHFGEGKYEETEKMIQTLLKEAGNNVSETVTSQQNNMPGGDISPETYFGSNRMAYHYPQEKVDNGDQNFTLEKNVPINRFSFGGNWTITGESADTGKDAILLYKFNAEHVYMVLKQGTSVNGKIQVFLDGKLIDKNSAGADVKNGIITVNEDRLFDVVNLQGKSGTHTLELHFQSSGIEAYTFTFG